MNEPRWKEIIMHFEGGKYPSKNRKLSVHDFELKEGVLYCVNSQKVWEVFQQVITHKLRSSASKLTHASKIAGRPGIYKTHLRAKYLFYFPCMLLEVFNT